MNPSPDNPELDLHRLGDRCPEARRTVGPDMNLRHVTNRAGPNDFDGFTKSVFGRPLIAHLSHNTHFSGDFTHHAGFTNGPGQWLLAVDMLLHLHGLDGRSRMRMVRRADRHDVHFVAELIQHFAEVRELLSVVEFFCFLVKRSTIDVTNADNLDILIGNMAAVAAAFAANADTGRCQTFQSRSTWVCERSRSNPETRSPERQMCREIRDVMFFVSLSVPQKILVGQINHRTQTRATLHVRPMDAIFRHDRPKDKSLTITTPQKTTIIRRIPAGLAATCFARGKRDDRRASLRKCRLRRTLRNQATVYWTPGC